MRAHDRTFNSEALYLALDKRRRELHIPWREVARQSGTATVNLGTRLGEGRSLSADNLVKLLLWLGSTDLAPFVLPSAQRSAEGAHINDGDRVDG